MISSKTLKSLQAYRQECDALFCQDEQLMGSVITRSNQTSGTNIVALRFLGAWLVVCTKFVSSVQPQERYDDGRKSKENLRGLVMRSLQMLESKRLRLHLTLISVEIKIGVCGRLVYSRKLFSFASSRHLKCLCGVKYNIV